MLKRLLVIIYMVLFIGILRMRSGRLFHFEQKMVKWTFDNNSKEQN